MTDEREESAGESDPAESTETAEGDPDAVDGDERGAGDPTAPEDAAADGSEPAETVPPDRPTETGVDGQGSEDEPGTARLSAGDDEDESAVSTRGPDGLEESADEDPTADGETTAGEGATAADDGSQPAYGPGVPEDVRTYDRFQKIDGSTYERANDFLRDRTYVTAREWAIARLCADFRTETGVEMTKIGENLPELVPFMTDTYSPQAVNQARAAFEEKVRKAGATFLYGAMSDFFTAEELDDVMYESTEVAKFLLEVEGVDLTVEEELEAEDEISEVMREVREHSAALRHDEVVCPECGHHIEAEDA